MLASNGRNSKVKNNYHITNEELKILFRYSAFYGYKYQVLISFCAFRGLRVSEALAVNMFDFNQDFSKITIREAKTNKVRTLPLIKPLQEMIKHYITLNVHTLKNGFLFPYYSSKKRPYLSCGSAEAWFSKIRNKIGEKNPSFMDKVAIPRPFTKNKSEEPIMTFRYRIGFHSLRRWFETRLWNATKNAYIVKELMDYTDYNVLNSYLDRNQIKEHEKEILEEALNNYANELIRNDESNNQKEDNMLCQATREGDNKPNIPSH